MLDAKFVESKSQLVKNMLAARGMNTEIKNVDIFLERRAAWKKIIQEIETLRHKKNVLSLEINAAFKTGDKIEAEKKKQEAKAIDEQLCNKEMRAAELEKELFEIAQHFPNMIAELPKKSKIVASVGKAEKKSWQKSYIELAKVLDILDFDSARRMTGEGFCTFVDMGARLQRALINFFLETARKSGYKEYFPPILINEAAAFASGQLPRFEEGMYKTREGFYLVPTAELSLLNLNAGKTFSARELPIYVTAYSPCFRTEKGATHGLVRVHQFDKVELFKFVRQEESFEELECMVKNASKILEQLKIPHRIKLLSAEEIGIAAAKTYDIEAFCPASGWLEVSSCSNCTDFQARRAKIYYLEKGERKLVHTLNGSGLAVPRTFIALLENHQQKDGSIKIPSALWKYTGFKKIEKK